MVRIHGVAQRYWKRVVAVWTVCMEFEQITVTESAQQLTSTIGINTGN